MSTLRYYFDTSGRLPDPDESFPVFSPPSHIGAHYAYDTGNPGNCLTLRPELTGNGGWGIDPLGGTEPPGLWSGTVSVGPPIGSDGVLSGELLLSLVNIKSQQAGLSAIVRVSIYAWRDADGGSLVGYLVAPRDLPDSEPLEPWPGDPYTPFLNTKKLLEVLPIAKISVQAGDRLVVELAERVTGFQAGVANQSYGVQFRSNTDPAVPFFAYIELESPVDPSDSLDIGDQNLPARDLALNLSGDLMLRGGDLALTTGTPSIASDIEARLKLFLGEWFLNPDEGTPWFQQVFTKNPSAANIIRILTERIEGTPGVASVSDFRLNYEPTARSVSVEARATTDTGEIINIRTGV